MLLILLGQWTRRRAHCALPRSSASENVAPHSASAGRWQVKQGRPKTVVQPPRHGSAPCEGQKASQTMVWLGGSCEKKGSAMHKFATSYSHTCSAWPAIRSLFDHFC